jgi:hypothetical protein
MKPITSADAIHAAMDLAMFNLMREYVELMIRMGVKDIPLHRV